MTIIASSTEHPVEGTRKAIQTRIDARRTGAERNRLGQFATPNELAIEIARYVESLIEPSAHGIRFADPSIGSGSFFSAALTVFGRDGIRSAVGVEIDPAFAEAARSLWGTFGLEVIERDFTRLPLAGSRKAAPNVVLANPPYVRHHHMERGEKERLQQLAKELTGVEVNGLAGLYVYFLLLATAWMADDGIAAWLIPSEFMDVNYGSSLKQFLTDDVTLIRVHRFDPENAQFGDALVSSAVIVFRKSKPAKDHMPSFSYAGTLAEPSASRMVPLDELRASRKWTVHPAHAGNDRIVSGAEGPVLGDFFRIQRGIATGCNKFFILERDDAERRGLPARYLRPILPSPRHLKATVIEGDLEGYPLLDPQLCVIDCDIHAEVLEAKHPSLWAYLQTAKALGVMDRYLIGKRTPWYKQEQREPAPFLCTYMGRGTDDKQPFRFIWNRSKAIGTNLFLMLYPTSPMAMLLRSHPDREEIVHRLLGAVTGNELRGQGRVYGGGLNKIEPSELARVSALPFVEHWPELRTETRLQRSLFEE